MYRFNCLQLYFTNYLSYVNNQHTLNGKNTNGLVHIKYLMHPDICVFQSLIFTYFSHSAFVQPAHFSQVILGQVTPG